MKKSHQQPTQLLQTMATQQPPFNIGIIGCGAIAREHLAAIQTIPGLKPYAYCDLHGERAESFLRDYGGSYAATSPGRLLDDPAINALYICTHHDTHTPLAVAACEAGKNVMMEKPLALTVDECTEIGSNHRNRSPVGQHDFDPVIVVQIVHRHNPLEAHRD